MKKGLTLIFLFLMTFGWSTAQTTFQIDYNIASQDLFATAFENSSNQYIVGGTAFGFSGMDVSFIAMDSLGAVVWAKQYSEGPFTFNNVTDAALTSDGGYIATGSSDNNDLLLLKLDAGGNVQWDNEYGGAGSESGSRVFQTSDGGYVAVGSSTGSFGTKDSSSVYIVKVNSAGTLLWDGSYHIGNPAIDSNDGLSGVDEVSDGYVFTGYHSQVFGPDTTQDILLMKTDFSGNLQWIKAFGDNNDSEYGVAVTFLSTNQLLLCGYTDKNADMDNFLIRTDLSGNSNFSSAYDAGLLIDMPGSCVETSDGGYAIIGFTETNLFPLTPAGYLLKTNSSGTIQFDRHYLMGNSPMIKGAQATDGGFIMGAISNTLGYRIIKTDIVGATGCNETSYTSTQLTYSPSVETPATVAYSGGSQSGVSLTASNVTPTKSTLCLTCSPSPASVSPSSATICNGQSTTLTASGGGTYNWSTGATTTSVTVSPSSTTSYTVTVTNGGCDSIPPSVTVTVNATPTASISGTTTICTGENTTLTASGGDTYNWDTGASTAAITVSPASTTTYTVTVTNSSTGCTDVTSSTVTVNSPPVASISGTVTICEGASTTLTASGGASYSWNTGATTAAITVSPAITTTYYVTVTSGSCSDSTNTTVTVNPAPTASITGDSVLCSGNTATFTASGGDTYAWSTGATTPSITDNPSSNTTYTVTVTSSATGCTDDTSATLIVNTNPISAISSSATTICSGDTVLLVASGGDTYSWNTGSSNDSISISPTDTTTYLVTVTNSTTTCFDDTSITIIVNQTPIAAISGGTFLCDGDSTVLVASGGDTYSWSTGATNDSITVIPVADSTFAVTVTNSAGGCTDTASVLVSVNPSAVATISGDTVICLGDTTVLSATGGTSFSWNTGATTSSISVSPSSISVYSVTVTTGSCVDSTTFSLAVDPAADASISGQSAICQGDTIVLAATGGSTYLWSTGDTSSSISVSPSADSLFAVVATNSTGSCSDTASLLVTVSAAVAAGITGDTVICEGDSVTLVASGGGAYSWNTGASTDTILEIPLTTTVYSVTVSAGSCADSAALTVNVNPIPNATISGQDSICEGDTVALITNGSGNYFWSTGDTSQFITISPDSNTTYSITVTDSVSGCFSMDSIQIVVNPIPTAMISGNDTICSGASTTLSASGGTSYQWSDGSTGSSITVSPLADTVYSVTVTTSGCSDDTSMAVIVKPSPTASISGENALCEGETDTLVASGGDSYSWNTGSSNDTIFIAPLTSSSYSVMVTDSTTGCTDVDSVFIAVTLLPVANIVGDSGICTGDLLTLTASGGSGFQWSTGGTDSTVTVFISSDSTITVTVTNSCGSGVDAVSVNAYSLPDADAGEDTTIVLGGSVELNGSGGGDYTWSPDDDLSCDDCDDPIASPAQSTLYTLTVTDNNGCSASDEVLVSIDFDVFLNLPNVFSPNGDGSNDMLLPFAKGVAQFRLIIYDRWGEVVYESTNVNEGWDGSHKRNGKMMNTAVFAYILEGTLVNGQTVYEKGNVTLLR